MEEGQGRREGSTKRGSEGRNGGMEMEVRRKRGREAYRRERRKARREDRMEERRREEMGARRDEGSEALRKGMSGGTERGRGGEKEGGMDGGHGRGHGGGTEGAQRGHGGGYGEGKVRDIKVGIEGGTVGRTKGGTKEGIEGGPERRPDGRKNTTAGTRTQPKIPESLQTVAEEIAHMLDLYTDDDDVALMNMRHIPGFDQRNVKLIKLFGISPGDCSFMEIDVDQSKSFSDNEQKHAELPITSTLSKLIRGHLVKRKCRDNNGNADKVSESNVTQPTLDAHEKYERVSIATSVVMSYIGYGPDIRKQRIEANKVFLDVEFKSFDFPFSSYVMAGSKSEGLTRFCESDFDIIAILDCVICFENDTDASDLDVNKNVLMMETDDISPGYCRLVLKRSNSRIAFAISRAFLKDGTGRLFLSSDIFRKLTGGWFLSVPDEKKLPRAGPSLPSSIFNLKFDRVVALRCHCPNILNRWAERPRHWPSPDVVKKVVSLEAFATPVGSKNNKSSHLEWRICFNKAETELIISLNDTQTKLYVLMKMVVKDLLKPCRKEITSFTVKNIVLWLAENNQQALFHDRSLLHWLHKGLEELRRAIATQNLAFYMLPERNLMAGCGLKNEQQRAWVKTLTDMLDEGPSVILRFDRISQAIISYPEPLFWYSQIRTEYEMLSLCFMKKYTQQMYKLGEGTDSGKTIREVYKRMFEIVDELEERLIQEGIWFDDVLELFGQLS